MNINEAQETRLKNAVDLKGQTIVGVGENNDELVLVLKSGWWFGAKAQAYNDDEAQILTAERISEDILLETKVITDKIDPEVIELAERAKIKGYRLEKIR